MQDQDMQRGKATKTDFLNGLVVREGEKPGTACRANAVLTDLVTRVERGELKPDPRHRAQAQLGRVASAKGQVKKLARERQRLTAGANAMVGPH